MVVQMKSYTSRGDTILIEKLAPVTTTVTGNLSVKGMTIAERDSLNALHQSLPLRMLPASVRPYAELVRIHRPAGFFMFFFPCLYGLFTAAAMNRQVKSLHVLQTTGTLLSLSMLLRGTLCTWNDIIDRDVDRKVARTRIRPLARHAISTPAAVLWTLVQAIAVGFNFSALPSSCVKHAVPWMILHVFYPFMKRWSSHPQLVLGFAHSYGAIIAFPALGEPIGNESGAIGQRNTVAAAYLCIAITAWTLINDTIYAAQDAVDDKKSGIGSTVMFWGKLTRPFLRVLALAQMAAMAAMYPLLQHSSPSHGIPFANLSFGVTLLGLIAMVESVDLDSPTSCGWWFNTGNVWLGATMGLGFVLEFFGRFLFA